MYAMKRALYDLARLEQAPSMGQLPAVTIPPEVPARLVIVRGLHSDLSRAMAQRGRLTGSSDVSVRLGIGWEVVFLLVAAAIGGVLYYTYRRR
jgi:hypothetical protein